MKSKAGSIESYLSFKDDEFALNQDGFLHNARFPHSRLGNNKEESPHRESSKETIEAFFDTAN